MNLIEALKTDKQLRRPIVKHMGSKGDGWLSNALLLTILLDNNNKFSSINNYADRLMSKEDLLADDWEIKEELIVSGDDEISVKTNFREFL